MTSTQYSKPVADFLESIGVTMTLQGPDKVSPSWSPFANMVVLNTFPRKDNIHGDRWTVTFERADRKPIQIQYWDSYHDAELRDMARRRQEYKPGFGQISRQAQRQLDSHGLKSYAQIPKLMDIKPSSYDVLACIGKYHPGSHEEFCAGWDYNPDSMKDFEAYQAVLREWGQVSRFFTTSELETLQEIAQ
jgi:hypothetical protein